MIEFAKWRRRHCKHVRLKIETVISSLPTILIKKSILSEWKFFIFTTIMFIFELFPFDKQSCRLRKTMAHYGTELTAKQNEIIISLLNKAIQAIKFRIWPTLIVEQFRNFLKECAREET